MSVEFEDAAQYRVTPRTTMSSQKSTALTSILVKLGLARDYPSAQRMLFVIMLFCLMCTVAWFLIAIISSRPIPYGDLTDQQKGKLPYDARQLLEQHAN